jgi:hypothetical protein
MMTRNLKALFLALVAVFALSAIGASAAQAETTKFTAVETKENGEHPHVTTTGTVVQTSNQVFETGTTGKVTCTETSGEGSITGGEAETVEGETLTYSDCTFATTATNATVTMNGCKYTFTTPETITTNEATGKVDLFCPTGKVIEIHVYTAGGTSHGTSLCTITVYADETTVTGGKEEKLGGHVIYKNQVTTKPTDVNAEATIEGITTEEHGALCPDGNTVQHHDGIYNGNFTVKSTNAKVDVSVG